MRCRSKIDVIELKVYLLARPHRILSAGGLSCIIPLFYRRKRLRSPSTTIRHYENKKRLKSSLCWIQRLETGVMKLFPMDYQTKKLPKKRNGHSVSRRNGILFLTGQDWPLAPRHLAV